MIENFTFLQKTFFLLFVLCFVSTWAQAQNKLPETNENSTGQLAAKKSSEKIIETAKQYVRAQASRKAAEKNSTENEEGIISLLNKTIEELEERAERQYQDNRYVLIKED